MKQQRINEKIVKGKKIRTDNQSIEEIINLWMKVPEMNLTTDFYAVYHHYESDHTGKYDLLIGDEINLGPDIVTIETGNYLVIELEEGSPEKIGEAWQKIWADEEIYKKRLFTTDFEHYFKDGSATICLAIK